MAETRIEMNAEAARADARPALAVGHVELYVRSVTKTAEFLAQLGARSIVVRDELAILELPGGTHLVVMLSLPARPLPRPPRSRSYRASLPEEIRDR